MREIRRGIFLLTLALSTSVLITGCDKELSEMEESKVLKKLSPEDLELIQSTNSLSLNILNAQYQREKDENFIFSPVSTGMALGMIYNSVGDKEKFQIQRSIGLEALAEKEINKSYNEFITFLQLNYDPADVFCANSLWFSYDLDINENYRTKVMAYYDAEISELNFSKKSSLQSINNWGSLKSNGRLDELSSVSPSINYNIYLLNAFGVNSSWNGESFYLNNTRFTNHHGQHKEIKTVNLDQTMVMTNSTDYFDFVEIPLKEQNLLFSMIKPTDEIKIDEFLNDFSVAELLDQSSISERLDANVRMPDITFTKEINLKNTFAEIGLNSIFHPSLDLSPSFLTKEQGISAINQVSEFSIQAPGLANKSEFSNPELKLIDINRPFLYFLRDKHTQTIIFAGYYINPIE
jgi:serpin B